MSFKIFAKGALLTVLLAVASHGTHASGVDDQGRVAVRVRYDDLNLSVPAGVASLKRRVSSAAAQVCAAQYGSDRIDRHQQFSCIQRTTDKAMAQVKWPEK